MTTGLVFETEPDAEPETEGFVPSADPAPGRVAAAAAATSTKGAGRGTVSDHTIVAIETSASATSAATSGVRRDGAMVGGSASAGMLFSSSQWRRSRENARAER